MEKRFIIKVPPRPAVIRERYAGFLSELNRYLDHYKQGFIDGMNEKFELNEPKKTRPEANCRTPPDDGPAFFISNSALCA